MKKYAIIIGMFLLGACDARLDDMHPHNMSDAETYLNSVKNIINATSGLYGQFLDASSGGFSDMYNYYGSYHALSEFRGNNVVFNEAVSGTSGNALRCPDAHFFLNSDQKTDSYAWPIWAKTHYVILGTSQNIIAIDKLYAETVDLEAKEQLIRLKGENYFLRGLMIFNATNIFGRPYWDEPENNLGIPLDINAEAEELPRSTVKACFEQAIDDFKQAAACLPDEAASDRTYANKPAAYAMISKVYLYMGGRMDMPNNEFNQLAVNYADSVFNMTNDIVELLRGEDFKNLYENPKTNPEILFAFYTGNFPSTIGSIIHNFYSWSGRESQASTYEYPCVISKDYENIMDKEHDLRWVYFTEPSERHTGRYCTTKYNGGKTETSTNYYTFVAPCVFIRLGEVYLNRAEANVKLGNDGNALEDLNEIRGRAGLSTLSGLNGQMLFDSIFMERRRELAFESQTYYDYVRNGIKMTREEVSAGYPEYSGLEYNEIDPLTSRRTMCLIPADELLLNDQLVQNEY